VVKNAAPTALAVMGLQLGYLMGGSILVETVFSWPGTGLLLNSAIAHAQDPVRMAAAMKAAVVAGRQAFLAGRMPRDYRADASSPSAGLIRA